MVQRYRPVSKKYNSIAIALLILFCPGAVSASHDKAFDLFIEAVHRSTGEEKKYGDAFLRQFPTSSKVPQVRHLMALSNRSITETEMELQSVYQNYRQYHERKNVLIDLCHIYVLSSDWEKLETWSRKGTADFASEGNDGEFRMLLVYALLRQEKNDQAEEEINLAIERDRSPKTLVRALLTRAHIARRVYGFSREYAYRLREALLVSPQAVTTPGLILLLAEFYFEVGDVNRSWSAYNDIVKRFPRSPEADMAKLEIEKLKKQSPKTVPYIPSEKMVQSYSPIDIEPETPVDHRSLVQRNFAVSVGPLPSIQMARHYGAMMQEFGSVKIIQTRTGYLVITALNSTRDEAHNARIRLAEEFGFNGTIMRMEKEDGKEYLYGD